VEGKLRDSGSLQTARTVWDEHSLNGWACLVYFWVCVFTFSLHGLV